MNGRNASAVQWLQEREPTDAYPFDGAWFDIGTPESYLDAVAWHLDGESIVAESAAVENATIGDDVHVMTGATITDSHIEQSVVFPKMTIEGSELRRTTIDEETHLEGMSLSGTLIGPHLQVPDESNSSAD